MVVHEAIRVTQSGWGPQPNIARDLVAPHKGLGRSEWFYAQSANLYRGGKRASFSILMLLPHQIFASGEEIGS